MGKEIIDEEVELLFACDSSKTGGGSYSSFDYIGRDAVSYIDFVGYTLSGKFGVISTLVKKRRFRGDLYVPVIDCDSKRNLDDAIAWIRSKLKLNISVISSSKDRYWIILDKAMTYKDVCKILEKIPGADYKYVKFYTKGGDGRGEGKAPKTGRKHNLRAVIRAVPKSGKVYAPVFVTELSDDESNDPLVLDWLNKVLMYFESSHYSDLCDMREEEDKKNPPEEKSDDEDDYIYGSY